MTGVEGQAPRARIAQATVDEVRDRLRLSQLVARRVKLRRAGQGWSGLCPFHSEKSSSFTVQDAKQFYHCFGCGAHGDCFDWVQHVDGCDFREAIVRCAAEAGVAILGEDGQPIGPTGTSAALDGRVSARIEPRVALERAGPAVVGSDEAGRWIWRTALPARGEIVEDWLRFRGCAPSASFDGVVSAIDTLRFHPRCPLSAWRIEQDPRDVLTAPAMVAPIRDGDGLIRGVHVTYLRPDGRGKAQLRPYGDGRERPTRKIFGAVQGNAVWLTVPPALAVGLDPAKMPLIVGEGIETCWSFAQARERASYRVAAALSLDNLQGGAVKLNGGALPLWNIEADHGRPPFVVADAGEVIVLVDADMKPLRQQKVQQVRGMKPVRADIGGLLRAEICGRLAAQHWRRAGATKVTAVRPPLGMDFNDAGRRVA